MCKKLIVYLAGPIGGCTDDQCNDWRSSVMEQMGEDYTFLNPMDRDYRDRYIDPLIAPEVVELDKRDIRNSDVVFANITKDSAGTSMELLYSWERDKVIVTVVPSGKVVSPWILYHSTKIVHSIEEGIDWIRGFVR
jgi:nucleoside 2-deoxyribosyltransferase